MLFVITGAVLAITLTAAAAVALPSTTPGNTLGTNGKVRALLQVGNVMWIGGQFTALSDSTPVGGLAALDINTGQEASGVSPPILGGTGFVYDLTTDGSTVWAAGSFTAANGAKNLVAFNGATGALIQAFSAPALKAVLFDGGRILAGGGKLQAFLPNGKKDATWTVTTAKIDSTLRGHNTVGAYRDMKPAPGGGYFAACQCDWVLNPGESIGASTQTKAIVKLNANGSVNRSWVPAALNASSAAFGIDLYIDGSDVVLAAGGSDFTAKYNGSTGAKIWLTDTNGSSQAVTKFTDGSGSNYVVGGHYRCVGNTFHPRLSALSLTGALDPNWTIAPTPLYNGVWVVTQDTAGHLWIGGEFKKLGTGWVTSTCDNTKPVSTGSVTQQFVARFG
jgi:hypothetical protein